MQGRRPLIGVISDRRALGQHPYHLVGEKYLDAVLHGAGGLPVALPVLGGDFDIRELLGRLDGLLLTGSPSNVEPRRYQGQPLRPGMLHDPERDEVIQRLPDGLDCRGGGLILPIVVLRLAGVGRAGRARGGGILLGRDKFSFCPAASSL